MTRTEWNFFVGAVGNTRIVPTPILEKLVSMFEESASQVDLSYQERLDAVVASVKLHKLKVMIVSASRSRCSCSHRLTVREGPSFQRRLRIPTRVRCVFFPRPYPS